MRTKHLLYTAAIAAMFSACTNDDFMLDTPQNNVANDGRPTVSDVRLNFIGDDAETRLAFGKDGYAWEANDTIGALLMDEVNTVDPTKTWLERYSLVSNIHTSYPFTYSDGVWSCNTKMLEGNYFFAFPWESYNGQRKVMHSLTNQQQNGVKSNVVAESYAKNQFFIGYAQIKAGSEAKDALTDVEMTSLLGAIQLRIVNTGTQTYHINKVVLKGAQLSSVLTFDPTDAYYNGWNVDGNTFNYANYTGNQEDVYTTGSTNKVYNIGEEDNYDRMEALRAVVKDASDDAFAQLTINGTAEERALVSTKVNENAIAYALIMANAIPNVTVGELLLDIYTDEGIVSNIDLTKINGVDGDYVAITDSKVTKIAPSVSNTIKVQIDDNSFVVPKAMEIYNDEDLLQFIKWNARVAGARTCTATLMKPNVTLTKEMVDLLKANSNIDLKIKGSETLEIAEDVSADILDYAKLEINSAIEIMGTVSLTKNSTVPYTVNVAEGAVLNINEDKVNLSTVKNYGTVNIAKDIAVNDNATINNFAEMNIAEKADVKATVANQEDATLNNSGYMSALYNDGEVILSSTAIVVGGTNNEGGVIRTAKGAQVSVTNNGEIVYVEGAVINATGTISYEATGVTIGKDYFGTTTVNKLILKKGITTISVDSNFGDVVAEDGASLVVADKVTLTVGNLTVEGSASTKGNIVADIVEVKKDATLTNNGTIKANTSFYNFGVVANNGEVIFAYTLNGYNIGNWKYNPVEWESEPQTPDTSKQDTMNDAVAQWANYWGSYLALGTYYNANPYDVDKFIATVTAWAALTTDEAYVKAAKALETVWIANTGKTFAEVLKSGNNAVSEFTTAVDAILNANVATLKKTISATNGGFQGVTISQVATLFDTEAKAYDNLREALAKETSSMDAKVAAAAWKLSDSEIATALSKSANTVPYAYIWVGCKLDEVMTVYKQMAIGGWKQALSNDSLKPVTSAETLKAWMNAVAVTTDSSLYIEEAKTVVKKYLNEYKNWLYSENQIANCGN